VSSPAPLEILYDPACGDDLPLPGDLRELYGRLQFPSSGSRPYVIANFVTTLDGVVSLGIPGTTDGDAISGSNTQDSIVMGLLRSACDAVIVGAGTLRKSPRHIWTPGFVFPPLESSYNALRAALGMTERPLFAVVSARGSVDLGLPVFRDPGLVPAVVTTSAGETNLRRGNIPRGVEILSAGESDPLTVGEILGALSRRLPGGRKVLVEGGPHLVSQFFDAGALDELFLTVSPRLSAGVTCTIAGADFRKRVSPRPGKFQVLCAG
jgi:riboflavin biosynthesis pyrimidine reductase